MKTQFELVDVFAQTMKDELKANENKGDWREFKDKKDIHRELQYHYDKLRAAESWTKYNFSEDTAKERIKEHLADCANLLLKIRFCFWSLALKCIFEMKMQRKHNLLLFSEKSLHKCKNSNKLDALK